jgi:hypothetical protein
MTALLQSTPPRARNSLDLAFLIETGSATTQLMESGSALAMQLPMNTTCQGQSSKLMLHVQRKFSRPWCHWDSNCAIVDPVFFQNLFYKLASSGEGCALFQLLKLLAQLYRSSV